MDSEQQSGSFRSISINDIPQDLLDDIVLVLEKYLVPISVFSADEQDSVFRFIGSGTLVEVEGAHHILTAAHVWHQTQNAEKINLGITVYPSSGLTISRAAINPKELWNDDDSEWGPDLALLRLASSDASTIAAYKSFLNFAKQKMTFSKHAPVIENGFWAIIGLVGEFSSVQESTQTTTIIANAQKRAFFGGIHKSHQCDGFDYLDLNTKLSLSGVPSSFGGLSGGGLWEIGLKSDKFGTINWDEKLHLRGVAFWQSAESEGSRIIRCHGPRSIFQKAWQEWALPP